MNKRTAIVGLVTFILWFVFLFTGNKFAEVLLGSGIGWIGGTAIGELVFNH